MKKLILLLIIVLVPLACFAQRGSYEAKTKNNGYNAVYALKGTEIYDENQSGQIELKGQIGFLQRNSSRLYKVSFNSVIPKGSSTFDDKNATAMAHYKDSAGKNRQFQLFIRYNAFLREYELTGSSGSFGTIFARLVLQSGKKTNIDGSWKDLGFSLGGLKLTEVNNKVSGRYVGDGDAGGSTIQGTRKGDKLRIIIKVDPESTPLDADLRICPGGETIVGPIKDTSTGGILANIIWVRRPIGAANSIEYPEDENCNLVFWNN
jgi:hypothetical protein